MWDGIAVSSERLVISSFVFLTHPAVFRYLLKRPGRKAELQAAITTLACRNGYGLIRGWSFDVCFDLAIRVNRPLSIICALDLMNLLRTRMSDSVVRATRQPFRL